MGRFQGKTIVLTGGSGILCREMAKGFAAEGARVALIGRTERDLVQVADEINQMGGAALPLVADVLDYSALHTAREEIKERLGSCDILINGAGGNVAAANTDSPFFEMAKTLNNERTFFDLDPAAIADTFNLNFLGTFLPTQIFAKDMIGKEGCSILNISSVAAAKPLTKVSAYSAAKAAVTNFTGWMAVHFAKAGVRVNALAPGFFLTKQNKTLLTNENGSLTERGQTILEQTPMGRFGSPEDLMGGVLWISSQEAKFVTGTVLTIDGGFTAFNGV